MSVSTISICITAMRVGRALVYILHKKQKETYSGLRSLYDGLYREFVISHVKLQYCHGNVWRKMFRYNKQVKNQGL